MLYLDSSALVKLVAEEPETDALRAFTRGRRLVSSEIALVEVRRVARRLDAEARGAALLEGLVLVEIDDGILAGAVSADPEALSSLDALHLASAQFARDRIEHFVVYDARLAAAATAIGLDVAAPG